MIDTDIANIVVENGRDGRWSASAMGAMGRMCVAFGETGDRAREWLKILLIEQESEAYHHEQAMSHLSLSLEGEYDETRY